MLAHLGALGRHLGAHMSQHTPKIRSQMRSWSQHSQNQCPRRLNKPRIAKKQKNTKFFSLFLLSDPCAKMLPNRRQIDPKSTPKPPSGASSRHLSANMGQLGPPLLHLNAPLPRLGRTWATISREIRSQISPKTPQATPRPPKPRFWTILGRILDDFRSIQTPNFFDFDTFSHTNNCTETRLK